MSTDAWLSSNADVDCCDIVTTGRRSGSPHEIEIWFGVAIHDERTTMYLISGNGLSADWYQNLLFNREVVVMLAGEAHLGHARPVVEPDERRRVGDLMGAKYVWGGDPSIGLTYEAWCYAVPAIAIEFG
jgi:hypothetical protein